MNSMAQKLITKEIEKLLPAIGTTSELEARDVKVPLKLFNPCAAGTWYVTEADLATGEAFGYAEITDGELGYFDLNEIASVKLRFGLRIERDIHWDPNTTLKQVMDGDRR
jgi:hypothetical protein